MNYLDNFPCGICFRNINKNHRYLQCAICKYRFHIKCNKMDVNVYIKKKEAEDTICLKCMEENIPFQKITSRSEVD